MKRILTVVTLATVMVACNQTPKVADVTSTTPAVTQDTTGLSQFQAWKAQNELQNQNQFNQNTQSYAVQPQGAVNRTYTPSNSTTRTRTSSSGTRRSSGTSARRSSGTYSSSSSNTAQTTRKKGWSKAAKGAVIGGVTGGVAGAIINKRNRVVGGVVGGILGGGIGYGIGRGMDKKDGRY